jgi:type II secretory pathway pseudopilin PulG
MNVIVKRKKQEEAFTLMEVLITIFLLAVVLLTLITVFVYGFNLLSRTKQVNLATQIAHEEVEIIRNMTFDNIASLGTAFTNAKLSSLLNSQGTIAVEDSIGSDIKKVTVTVTWDYRGVQLKKDVVTLIAREGINKK